MYILAIGHIPTNLVPTHMTSTDACVVFFDFLSCLMLMVI